jgi:hypothetical protein
VKAARAATAIGSIVLAGVATGCAAGSSAPGGPGSAGAPAALGVHCSPGGVRVTSTVVTTTAGGIILHVTSSAPPGSYLDLLWVGGGQGSPAPSSGTWIVPVPPGALRISCRPNAGHEVAVEVTDAARHWRPTTLAALGCPVNPAVSWVTGRAQGATPRAAVAASVDTLSRAGGVRLDGAVSAAAAPIGYPEATSQTWIVSVAGRPRLTEVVARSGAIYEAAPDAVCSGAA